MDPLITEQTGPLAAASLAELEELLAISSPSGDHAGAEAAIARCAAFLPDAATSERVPCSTSAFAPDLVARIRGLGARRLLLLGHLDTVLTPADHSPQRHRDGRLYGAGAIDMKGGVALALAVAKALAAAPERFAELGLLLVSDEEGRSAPFAHVGRFAGYDACLCFEGGERTSAGEDGVIVRRKGAGTLRVRAAGRAAHSGSAPQDGRNALLALARVAATLAGEADPEGPERLMVVPTTLHCGEAFNVVPAEGELACDMRAADARCFDRVLATVPAELDEVRLSAGLERVWPPMDTEAATAGLLQRAERRLGRRLVARARGGASDASHFAAAIPLTVDGLGPCGAGAHTSAEFVDEASLGGRLEVALTLALSALER